jgi:hypothetical protein
VKSVPGPLDGFRTSVPSMLKYWLIGADCKAGWPAGLTRPAIS